MAEGWEGVVGGAGQSWGRGGGGAGKGRRLGRVGVGVRGRGARVFVCQSQGDKCPVTGQ